MTFLRYICVCVCVCVCATEYVLSQHQTCCLLLSLLYPQSDCGGSNGNMKARICRRQQKTGSLQVR